MAWRSLADEVADEFLEAQSPQVGTLQRVYHNRRYRPPTTWKVGRNGSAYPLHPTSLVVHCKNPECKQVIHNKGGHRDKSYCNNKCRNRTGYLRVNANARRRSRSYAPAIAVSLRNQGSEYVLPATGINLTIATETFQMTLLSAALKRTGGNKAEAARLLSINRTTLVEMLKRLQRSSRAKGNA